MRVGKASANMRLTVEGKRLLVLLAKQKGIPKTYVVEQLIREEAERRGIPIQVDPEEETTEGA
jgi:hypothetical protein